MVHAVKQYSIDRGRVPVPLTTGLVCVTDLHDAFAPMYS